MLRSSKFLLPVAALLLGGLTLVFLRSGGSSRGDAPLRRGPGRPAVDAGAFVEPSRASGPALALPRDPAAQGVQGRPEEEAETTEAAEVAPASGPLVFPPPQPPAPLVLKTERDPNLKLPEYRTFEPKEPRGGGRKKRRGGGR